MSRTRFKCVDCCVDTGKIHEHYFIHTELWLKVMPSIKGMLCIACLEKRLGRQLNKSDFTHCYINDPKHNTMSALLLRRILTQKDDKSYVVAWR